MLTAINPLHFVESLAKDFADDAKERHIQIAGFASPELPSSVLADAESVKALLEFLTRRAMDDVQHAKDSCVIIEALAGKGFDLDTIRFGVSDSRTSLPPGTARHISRNLPDQPADHATVQQLLDSMQTELSVDEDLIGRSTRFYFTVPLRRGKSEWHEPLLPEAVTRRKVFVVANDPPANRVIQHHSRHAGIHVEGAPTAAESFVEITRADNRFDILAVVPPIEDMHPLTIAKLVRESDLRYLKLLYVAEWADEKAQQDHLEAGYDATLAKPFTKKELFDAFSKLSGLIDVQPQKAPLVLVVEDNPINAQLAFFQLRKLGFDAEIVVNGQQALDAVETGQYAAVLMDLQMPVLDGIEATRRIRERESAKKSEPMPIIALTANIDKKQAALDAGCNCFLSKPANIDELKNSLNRCITARRHD